MGRLPPPPPPSVPEVNKRASFSDLPRAERVRVGLAFAGPPLLLAVVAALVVHCLHRRRTAAAVREAAAEKTAKDDAQRLCREQDEVIGQLNRELREERRCVRSLSGQFAALVNERTTALGGAGSGRASEGVAVRASGGGNEPEPEIQEEEAAANLRALELENAMSKLREQIFVREGQVNDIEILLHAEKRRNLHLQQEKLAGDEEARLHIRLLQDHVQAIEGMLHKQARSGGRLPIEAEILGLDDQLEDHWEAQRRSAGRRSGDVDGGGGAPSPLDGFLPAGSAGASKTMRDDGASSSAPPPEA